jgi:PIN domain-containing protein
LATSRPRSGSRRGSSKPQLPELFCDRSLGRIKVPSRLRDFHPVVIAHDDFFPQDTDDEVWLAEAGRRRWVVLMKDDRIRYRPGEQRSVLQARVACFCLNPSKGMTADQMADAFITALPTILRIVEESPKGGYIKGVNRRGQVRHLFP